MGPKLKRQRGGRSWITVKEKVMGLPQKKLRERSGVKADRPIKIAATQARGEHGRDLERKKRTGKWKEKKRKSRKATETGGEGSNNVARKRQRGNSNVESRKSPVLGRKGTKCKRRKTNNHTRKQRTDFHEQKEAKDSKK